MYISSTLLSYIKAASFGTEVLRRNNHEKITIISIIMPVFNYGMDSRFHR